MIRHAFFYNIYNNITRLSDVNDDVIYTYFNIKKTNSRLYATYTERDESKKKLKAN